MLELPPGIYSKYLILPKNCRKCRAVFIGKKKCCDSCLVLERERVGGYRRRWLAEGRCIQCGKPNDAAGSTCSTCCLKALSRKEFKTPDRWPELAAILRIQLNKCYLSGVDLIFGSSNIYNAVSLDHIVPKAVIGIKAASRNFNYRFVSMACNLGRYYEEDERYFAMCNMIAGIHPMPESLWQSHLRLDQTA